MIIESLLYPSLFKLDLADPPSKAPQGIDLLIGSDNYLSIVGVEVNGGGVLQLFGVS